MNNRLIGLITGLWFLVYFLVIMQDYAYSNIRNTGFYLSECALFNTYWLFFIPISYLLIRVFHFIGFDKYSLLLQLIVGIVLGVVLTGVHIALYAGLMTLTSQLLFTPSHLYQVILKGSISNDMYITAFYYILFLFAYKYVSNSYYQNSQITDDPQLEYLQVKQGGTKYVRVQLNKIVSILADKPYSTIYTSNEKFLMNQSLANLEKILPSSEFLRVHRSCLINKSYIQEITSRKNGDYDLVMSNGQNLRMSRHYKEIWQHLLALTTQQSKSS